MIDAEQQHQRSHAQRQEGQRLGVSEPEFGADEAGRPQHDEHSGTAKIAKSSKVQGISCYQLARGRRRRRSGWQCRRRHRRGECPLASRPAAWSSARS